MPLSDRQHWQMERHISAHTSYVRSSQNHVTPLNYIMESLERMLDARRGFTRDLSLPDALINGETDRASFWFSLAQHMAGSVREWHELELRRRMVFTWRAQAGRGGRDLPVLHQGAAQRQQARSNMVCEQGLRGR